MWHLAKPFALSLGGAIVTSNQGKGILVAADPRKVFVIHGRNSAARRAMFDFLRSIGLEPIEWEQAIEMAGGGSPYIGQVLDAAFGNAQAVVVLQTPDDVAYLHDSLAEPGDPDCEPKMQARQNVTFEAGMAMGRDQDRTILVTLGELRQFSDIHGRHYVRMDNSVGQRQALANRLKSAGCEVAISGTDWHTAGELTPPAPPGGGLPMGRKVPSSEALGKPTFKTTLDEPGGNKFGKLKLTNLGPGTAYNVTVRMADEKDNRGLVSDGERSPVPRLPRGATVQVMSLMPQRYGSGPRRPYFDVIVTATTEDGTGFTDTLLVTED